MSTKETKVAPSSSILPSSVPSLVPSSSQAPPPPPSSLPSKNGPSLCNFTSKAKPKKDVIENTDCPIFLRKTYHMIDTCDISVATWSEDGTSFLVKNVQILASKFLPQYFKHNQFSSFVRQLNFYGFRKEKNEFVRVMNNTANDDRRWHFRHEHFVRGRPELLSKITRRIPNKSSTRGGGGGNGSNGGNGGIGVSGGSGGNASGGGTDGSAANSNQRKNRIDKNQQNEENSKECQAMKSEIASLQHQLQSMESNIDQLSKSLNLKLKLSGSGMSTSSSTQPVGKSNGITRNLKGITNGNNTCSNNNSNLNQKAGISINNAKPTNNNKRLKTTVSINKQPKTNINTNTYNNNNQNKNNVGLLKLPTTTTTTTTTTNVSNTLSSKTNLPKTIESKHVASIDLPDLSMATDEDLFMEDVTTSLSRSLSPLARTNDDTSTSISANVNINASVSTSASASFARKEKEVSTNLLYPSGEHLTTSTGTIVEVDEMFASMENDLNSIADSTAKEEEEAIAIAIATNDIQPLPDFVPQPNKRGLAMKQIKKFDLLLQNLPTVQREQFVNKVLSEMSSAFGQTKIGLENNTCNSSSNNNNATIKLLDMTTLCEEEGLVQANLITALEHILSHHNVVSDEIKEKSSTNGCMSPTEDSSDKNKSKSSYVKIEV